MNVPQEMIINKSQWNYIIKHKSNFDANNPTSDKSQLGLWASY